MPVGRTWQPRKRCDPFGVNESQKSILVVPQVRSYGGRMRSVLHGEVSVL